MSLECKINIDLDKGIIDFSKENIDEIFKSILKRL